jgi:hypothetical protein
LTKSQKRPAQQNAAHTEAKGRGETRLRFRLRDHEAEGFDLANATMTTVYGPNRSCSPPGHEARYEGWFCPRHGPVYGASGRIRQGLAPLDLFVPDTTFLTDPKVKVG